jgi:hypothetical protein
MKVSKKTLALMATGGVIVCPAIVGRALTQDDRLIESLSDGYNIAESKVREVAVKCGLLPPLPPLPALLPLMPPPGGPCIACGLG